MKKLSLCSRCHSFFDFDLYFGLCPKCGQFHRDKDQIVNNEKIQIHPVEEHDHLGRPCKTSTSKQVTYSTKTPSESHKTSYDAPKVSTEVHNIPTTRVSIGQGSKVDAGAFGKYADVLNSPLDEKKKAFSLFGPIEGDFEAKFKKIFPIIWVAIIVIVMLSNVVVPLVVGQLSSLKKVDDSDIFFEENEQYAEIHAGDYMYVVYDGYILADSSDTEDFDEECKIPEGKMLIAIDMNILYSGDTDRDSFGRVMPTVLDGQDFREPTDYNIYSYWQEACGINMVLSEEDVYGTSESPKAYGYLFYLVEEGRDSVTVSLENREDGILKGMHDVNISLEDLRAQ